MAKNMKRILVKLRSTEGSGFTYYTKKNKNNSRERLEMMKYDPKLRKHVMFKEEKQSKQNLQSSYFQLDLFVSKIREDSQ